MGHLGQYNGMDRQTVKRRRARIEQLLQQYGPYHGVKSRIAAELGVSKYVISRDMRALNNRIMVTFAP